MVEKKKVKKPKKKSKRTPDKRRKKKKEEPSDYGIPWSKKPYEPRYPGFVQYREDGKYRCQARLNNSSKQCNGIAHFRTGYCTVHNRVINQLKEFSANIKKGSVKKEMLAVKQLPKEDKESIESEIIILMGILRAMINNYSDAEILKHPGRFAVIADTIAKMKKMQHEMQHGVMHVYRFETVQYVFQEVKLTIMKHVKDQQTIKLIAQDLQRIGVKIQEGQK